MVEENPYESPCFSGTKTLSIRWSLSTQMALLMAVMAVGAACFGPVATRNGLATRSHPLELSSVVYSGLFGLAGGHLAGHVLASLIERWPRRSYFQVPTEKIKRAIAAYAVMFFALTGWHVYNMNWFGLVSAFTMFSGMAILFLAARRIRLRDNSAS